MTERTIYVIEKQGADGSWFRVPRSFDSMSLAEIEAAFYKEPTRVVPMQEKRSV